MLKYLGTVPWNFSVSDTVTNLDQNWCAYVRQKINNHANLTSVKPGQGQGQGRGITQEYEPVVSFMNFLSLPHLTGRQWNRSSSAWIGQLAWKGKWLMQISPHPALALFGNNTWALTPRRAVCCPHTDMLLVRVSSICTLCNIFHLSTNRSATALQSQNLVKTNQIYFVTLSASLILSFDSGGWESLVTV